MAAYKDEQRGTWYVSFHYYDWTGKNCRKVKRGFKTKREATEWEHHFRMKEAADLDMTFGEFVQAYTRDMKPKLKHNTWLTKEHILRTKLLPYFENKKMCDIRAKDIIQWQNEQISYRDEKGKPYAPTYLKTLQSELSALFNHAVRFYELKSMSHFNIFDKVIFLKWETILDNNSREECTNLILSMISTDNYKILIEFKNVNFWCFQGNGHISGFYIKDMTVSGYENNSKYEVGDYEENEIEFTVQRLQLRTWKKWIITSRSLKQQDYNYFSDK